MTFWNFVTGNTLLYSGCCFLRVCKKNFAGFSGMVSSMTLGSNLVKYALSNLRRSWDKPCMKVCQASRRRCLFKPRMLVSKESVSEVTDLTYSAASSGLLCEGPFACSSSIVSCKKCVKTLFLLKDARYLFQSNSK